MIQRWSSNERENYASYASDLKSYGVDYDVFATSYYPEYHGTIKNLEEQLSAVHAVDGKDVMIAETSWARTSEAAGAYERSVQGQADEIADCVNLIHGLGDWGIGVFYWEPAWLDVPDHTETKREQYGVSWATSYAAGYDPSDAGKYYGGAPDMAASLFDADGHPLESLKTFRRVREGQ